MPTQVDEKEKTNDFELNYLEFRKGTGFQSEFIMP